MQDMFKELDPENDRQAKLIDGELFLFKNTPQPALLIECGFLSNENDAVRLGDAEFQKQVAFTIFRGIIDFMSQNQTDVQTEDFNEQNREGQNVLFMQ
jgi:N-acetylmuramoyl-L-alanine amidase